MKGFVKFLPWVGNNYAKGINQQRILVLGESHYCAHPSEAVPEITNKVISDLLDPNSEHEGYKNTYTKFERALAGDVLDNRGKQELWNRLIFYNYVQVPMVGARVSPTKADFSNSESSFFEVLEQYRPDVIFVWGQRLYNQLPQSGKQGPDHRLPDGKVTETWSYTLSGEHLVRVMPINHPSSAFVVEYWGQGMRGYLFV